LEDIVIYTEKLSSRVKYLYRGIEEDLNLFGDIGENG
jgi:hypothetical protein